MIYSADLRRSGEIVEVELTYETMPTMGTLPPQDALEKKREKLISCLSDVAQGKTVVRPEEIDKLESELHEVDRLLGAYQDAAKRKIEEKTRFCPTCGSLTLHSRDDAQRENHWFWNLLLGITGVNAIGAFFETMHWYCDVCGHRNDDAKPMSQMSPEEIQQYRH